MKLEELVPPLELCKLIPAGSFEDCALVWIEVEIPQENKKEWRVVAANKIFRTCHNPKYPAPTLEEIMEALPHDDAYNDLLIGYSEKVDKLTGWHIYYNGNRKRHCYDKRAVTAALKLWLKLKGIEDENSNHQHKA
jgi:hypothetical protein